MRGNLGNLPSATRLLGMYLFSPVHPANGRTRDEMYLVKGLTGKLGFLQGFLQGEFSYQGSTGVALAIP